MKSFLSHKRYLRSRNLLLLLFFLLYLGLLLYNFSLLNLFLWLFFNLNWLLFHRLRRLMIIQVRVIKNFIHFLHEILVIRWVRLRLLYFSLHILGCENLFDIMLLLRLFFTFVVENWNFFWQGLLVFNINWNGQILLGFFLWGFFVGFLTEFIG